MIPWQKYAGASDLFMVDFSNQLSIGDNLVGVAITATDGVTIGEKTLYPSAVKFRLTGGVSGALAKIICTVTTATGDTLVAEPLLDIL